MWRKLSVVLLVCGLALAAFGQRQPAVTWRTVLSGTTCQATQAGTYVFQTQNDLANYWQRTFGSTAGMPVDVVWAREVVAAVNLGPRPKTGYSVYVQSVDKVSANEVRVTWAERYPPSDAATQPAKLSPFEVIRMNRVGAARFSFAQGPSFAAPLSVLAQQGVSTQPYYDCPWSPYTTGDLCQAQSYYGGVIVDYPGLQGYWGTTFGAGVVVPSNIDFTSEQLVVLNLGRRPTTGYGAVVMGLKWVTRDTVQVEWYEKAPPPGSIQAMHVTSPFTMLKLPKGNVKVVFKKLPAPAASASGSGG